MFLTVVTIIPRVMKLIPKTYSILMRVSYARRAIVITIIFFFLRCACVCVCVPTVFRKNRLHHTADIIIILTRKNDHINLCVCRGRVAPSCRIEVDDDFGRSIACAQRNRSPPDATENVTTTGGEDRCTREYSVGRTRW